MKISAVSILISFDELALASTTLFTNFLTWNDANQYCKSIGQHLVTIDEPAKQQLLHEALLDIEDNTSNFEGDIWIGLHVPDLNQPTNCVWTNDCLSSDSFSNWSPGLNSGNDNLCGYVEVEYDDMHWLLADCGSDTKTFICESDTAIFKSGFYYEIEDNTRASIGLTGIETHGTEEECIDHCNGIAVCWAFSFQSSKSKCVMYDKYDGPYYTNNDQIFAPGEHLYMKRNFELNEDNTVLSVPPYDDCGSVVVSDCVLCVTTEVKTTTEYTTTSEIVTTSSIVSSVDKTTEATMPQITETHLSSALELTSPEKTTEAAIPTTTGNYVSPEFEVTSSDKTTKTTISPTTENHVSYAREVTSSGFTTTIPPTTENHVPSSLEVTSSDFPITTSHSEITSITNSSINQTTHKEQSKDKTPYCVCTCYNITKEISLEESIHEIVNEIKVDSTKTSSYTRKHTSAWDSRKSSASIGFVGITLLISVASLLLYLDSTSLIYRVFALLRKPGTILNVHNENGR